MEIGGRNLLPSFSSGKWNRLTGSDVIVVSPYEIIRKSPYVSRHYSETNVYIEGGNTFTFSGRIGGLLTIYEYDSENTRIRTVVSYQNIQKITFTTLPQTAHLNIILSVLNLPDGDYSFSNVKLEKGNKATDWSPAPEDQVSDWNTTDVNSFSFIKNKPTQLSQFTDNIGVASHIANKANPHNVTKSQVGLGNVDNTSDLLKPISTAVQTALNLKANLASPTFTGNVTAPKVNFGNGFTLEASGTQLVIKYNGVIKQRFLSDGSIASTNELSAHQ